MATRSVYMFPIVNDYVKNTFSFYSPVFSCFEQPCLFS